ncbi:hypothetical protein V1511DRAFT_496208 [Dipodascopsis uninucleata]
MGVSSSKESRTFLPTTPVQFSQDLVEKLEDSPETDFTRRQDRGLKVENSVTEELLKIQEDTRKLVEDGWSKAKATTVDDDSSISSPALLEEISKFKSHLLERKEAIAERAEKGKAVGYEGPRDKLIACLQKNDRKPLVCLDEFNALKAKLESVIV